MSVHVQIQAPLQELNLINRKFISKEILVGKKKNKSDTNIPHGRQLFLRSYFGIESIVGLNVLTRLLIRM